MDRPHQLFETFAATDDKLRRALYLEADRTINSFIARKDLAVQNVYRSVACWYLWRSLNNV